MRGIRFCLATAGLLVATAAGAAGSVRTPGNESTVTAERTAAGPEAAAPLEQAQRHLGQAARDYAATSYATARADLARAAAWLEQVGKGADEIAAAEAQKLAREVTALLERVEQGGADVGAAISGLWHRSVALAERQADRVAEHRRGLFAAGQVRKELVEAKLHLTYAEGSQIITGETDQAVRELDRATAHLQAAAREAGQDRRLRIDEVRREADELRADVHDRSDQATARYAKAKADLRRLIRGL